MFCPNENTPMHQAVVPSHYGQKISIDQCGNCGGLWFDAFELYKIKQGEAQAIEAVDPEILRSPSEIDNPSLRCPRDQAKLFHYKDPTFPKSIVLMRCPTCQGFWLNRGEFTRYQDARQKLKAPKTKTPQDLKLQEDIKHLLAPNRSGSGLDALTKVGAFLSAPVGGHAAYGSGSSHEQDEEGTSMGPILDILITLLRLFIFRS
jgi:Zn-finger nucleic acid-binding protein